MAVLFLSTRGHRITGRQLEEMKQEFASLDAKTPQQILNFYQTRKDASDAMTDERRLPQLHKV